MGSQQSTPASQVHERLMPSLQRLGKHWYCQESVAACGTGETARKNPNKGCGIH